MKNTCLLALITVLFAVTSPAFGVDLFSITQSAATPSVSNNGVLDYTDYTGAIPYSTGDGHRGGLASMKYVCADGAIIVRDFWNTCVQHTIAGDETTMVFASETWSNGAVDTFIISRFTESLLLPESDNLSGTASTGGGTIVHNLDVEFYFTCQS